jgi:hypothetical protein
MNIIRFPVKERFENPLPKQRVFYIGFRYVGPYLCQEVQNLYLKRKGLNKGVRRWSIITYGKYNEGDSKEYSIELEQCNEDDLLSMLNEFEMGEEVSIEELRDMGWRGEIDYSASLIKLYSASVTSLIHKCYHNVIFPHFVKPLETGQFNGTDIMMESRNAQSALKGKSHYAFTHFRNRYPLGHVWMNLHKINSDEYAAVPVSPIKKFEEIFYKKYFIDRFKR